MKRSIVITKPARLSIDRARLCVTQEGESHYVPVEDIDVVVIDHDAIDLTVHTLSALTAGGVVTVVCDEKHLPCGYVLPLQNHGLMAQTLRGQINASAPTKKRIWQSIIVAKIAAQASLLKENQLDSSALTKLESAVMSGDSTNCEGRAASIYFGKLYGLGFERLRGDEISSSADDPVSLANAAMNYGYAILRACVARGIVASGLNPTLGVFHRHRNNPLALADDLMEPLRPLVDRIVLQVVRQPKAEPTESLLTPSIKRQLLQVMTSEVQFECKFTPLDVALTSYVKDVRQCLLGEQKRIRVPSG